MLEDFREVIEENLPSQVGKVLQERLARVEELEEQVKRMSDIDAENKKLKEAVKSIEDRELKFKRYK